MGTITVTDAFELILEAFEAHVLCTGTMSAKYESRKDRELSKEIRELEEVSGQLERVYRKWLTVAAREKGGHLGKLPTMASLGVRTSEYGYKDAILDALMQYEGRGDYDEIIEEVGRNVEITKADKQRMLSYPFNPRWSMAVFNAILHMLNEDLLAEDDDGYLILTEKGKEAYAKQFKTSE